MKITILSIILFMALILPGQIEAQSKSDTLPDDYKKNIVKWNLTPFILWSNQNLNFSYERILKPYRSFSVNAGYFVMPTVGIYDSLNISADRKKSGFTVSGDYRFYFKNRNTRNAPDGLYWGAYGSFHRYQFQNTVEVINSATAQGSLLLDGGFNIYSAGVELGYQFVIKDRLAIDLIFMGPSLSVYSGKLSLDGDLTIDEDNEYQKVIRDILVSRLPFLDELIREGTFDDKGVSTSIGFGLRYMVQIGYRF